jgi:hypothetical protein
MHDGKIAVMLAISAGDRLETATGRRGGINASAGRANPRWVGRWAVRAAGGPSGSGDAAPGFSWRPREAEEGGTGVGRAPSVLPGRLAGRFGGRLAVPVGPFGLGRLGDDRWRLGSFWSRGILGFGDFGCVLEFRKRMIEELVIQGSGVEILGERNLGEVT